MGTITKKSDSLEVFPWLSSMLQTVDPLFPIGSYDHSYGLEEMVASGIVTTEEQLSFYLQSVVQLNLSQFELPYLRYTYYAQQEGSKSDIARIDDEIGASLLSSEIRSASAAQGITATSATEQAVARYRNRPPGGSSSNRRGRSPPSYRFCRRTYPASNAIKGYSRILGLSRLAAPCSATLKIMRIGQEAAQRTLTRALDTLPQLVEESLNVERVGRSI